MPAINRTLPVSEMAKLLTQQKASAADQHLMAVRKWPGATNMLALAEAVTQRSKFVIFEGNKKFEIRYDSKYDAVFVKPVGQASDFVPCGYFSYKKLKEALAESGVNSESA